MISKFTIKICHSRNHNIPSMAVYKPGVHCYTCPDCGQKQTFVIQSHFM